MATLTNIALQLPESAEMTGAMVIVQSALYYISRFKGKFVLAATLSAIEINLVTGIKYFYNAGISGPTLLTSVLSFYLIILVIPRRQWLVWVIINIAITLGICYAEYLHPELIQHRYNTRAELFLDNIVGYVIVITMIWMCTSIVMRNYNRQKQIAEEKAADLELLNREKDKLFSIISHDMNAPLHSAVQYLQSLTELDLSEEERLDVEKGLLRNLVDAQELLNNLLRWARNQMQGTVLRRQSINIFEQLTKAATVFEPIALKKNISFETDITTDIIAETDAEMLQLIVRNLLNNAVKFTRHGRITLKAYVASGECIISVTDTGIGIPADRQKHLFSLKAGTTFGTQNEKGAGIGLALCRDYATLMGGRVWFESVEGRGSCFYLSLPL